MSAAETNLYETHRNFISCRMFSNMHVDKPHHTEDVEAEIHAWLAVLDKLATDAAFTENVMSKTRMKDATASQIWFEIVPVKDVVRQSQTVTSIRQTICTVPDRCWFLAETALNIFETEYNLNLQYISAWVRHGCFLYAPNSIARAAVHTVVKTEDDIRDGRHEAATVIHKIRMGCADWTTAMMICQKALHIREKLPFRSPEPKEDDPRSKLRHCLNVLEALKDSDVEFVQLKYLKDNQLLLFHGFIAVFDWNLVAKAPNAARDVLCCISKLGALGHNCLFVDVTVFNTVTIKTVLNTVMLV